MSPTSTLTDPTSRKRSPVPRRVKPGSVSTETTSSQRPPLTRVGPTPDEQQVVMIDLDKLHRHPKNRVIDPTSLDDLVQSLQEHGQREPIRVRPLPDPIGHFEIISGERRYLASLRCEPPIDGLRAIVETQADSTALIDLAVANAAREDLDPIQRAELMIELIMPVEQGGAGMDKAAAGRVFGLNSESGVKNALRLLQLPQFFRDLLSAKKVPVNKVRPLCAYPTELLECFAKWLQDSKSKWRLKRFLQPLRDDDEEIDGELLDFIQHDDSGPRTCDHHEQNLGYQIGTWPCLFKLDELTEKQRTELQIVEIPYKAHHWNEKVKANETQLVALNLKAWHKLQDPLIKAAKEKQKSKGSKSKAVASVKGDEPTKPTAAELKAKRKKADEQLEHYTRDWISRALRYHCSETRNWTQDEVRVLNLLPWLLASTYDCSSTHMQSWNDWAIVEITATDTNPKRKRGSAATALEFREAVTGDAVTFYAVLWRVILWPAGNGSIYHPDLAPPGTIPERMPNFGTRQINELAEACGVSIETVWAAAAKDSMQRSLVRQWLMRHTKEQLSDLGVALGHRLMGGSRDDMCTELLAQHQSSPQKKPLKLPAMIAKIAGIKKGGAK
jgi:ParB family transcriptional regulator, chromosome partitioning protein